MEILRQQGKITFFNQSESFPWPIIAENACGPTVAAMAINLVNQRRGTLKRNEVTPLSILVRACEIQKLPGPYWYIVKVSIPGLEKATILTIPIGETVTDEFAERVANTKGLNVSLLQGEESGEYEPIFTLSRGWDHRGSKVFFSGFGITAEQLGDKDAQISFIQLEKEMREGNLILASVKHTKDSSHVVLLWDSRGEDLELEFLVFDPLDTEPKWKNALRWYEEEFRGYGTIIMNTRNKNKH